MKTVSRPGTGSMRHDALCWTHYIGLAPVHRARGGSGAGAQPLRIIGSGIAGSRCRREREPSKSANQPMRFGNAGGCWTADRRFRGSWRCCEGREPRVAVLGRLPLRSRGSWGRDGNRSGVRTHRLRSAGIRTFRPQSTMEPASDAEAAPRVRRISPSCRTVQCRVRLGLWEAPDGIRGWRRSRARSGAAQPPRLHGGRNPVSL